MHTLLKIDTKKCTDVENSIKKIKLVKFGKEYWENTKAGNYLSNNWWNRYLLG